MRFSKFFKWHLYKYEDFLWLKFQLSLTLFTGVIAPNPPKWAQQGLKQKKKQLFLLGKVVNRKYTKAESWHPESIHRRSYYRLCENFWWFFGTAPWGQFRPLFFFFFFYYLVLQEFCDFSETWDFRYLIFLRMHFLQKFWFLAKFSVSQQ